MPCNVTKQNGCSKKDSCLICNTSNVYDWLKDISKISNKSYDILEVSFKGFKTEFFKINNQLDLNPHDYIVVETDSGVGYDIGKVVAVGEIVLHQIQKKNLSTKDIIKKVIRKTNQADLDKLKTIKAVEVNTLHKARKIITQLDLNMKLSDVNYQGDLTKATFYYTADSRIDFRELIKKMAEAFKIRIEMRQISKRHEAKRLDFIGPCGRELCCSTWIHTFKNVSISAARYQNISINTFKLAGQCGKLKCCLNYELENYIDALKDIPSHIKSLKTKDGDAILQKIDIFKKIMWFSYVNEELWIPLESSTVENIKKMNDQGSLPNSLKDFTIEKDIKEIALGYGNTIEHDSITRLDKLIKPRDRKHSKYINKKN
ncbi:MAG: PSP1 domain-containing protein [Solitalea-like symbiont of Acarus siro]